MFDLFLVAPVWLIFVEGGEQMVIVPRGFSFTQIIVIH